MTKSAPTCFRNRVMIRDLTCIRVSVQPHKRVCRKSFGIRPAQLRASHSPTTSLRSTVMLTSTTLFKYTSYSEWGRKRWELETETRTESKSAYRIRLSNSSKLHMTKSHRDWYWLQLFTSSCLFPRIQTAVPWRQKEIQKVEKYMKTRRRKKRVYVYACG